MGSLRNLLRFRPSPGTVIACIALLVACTGTATAATLITSEQIKNNSVTTKDVKNNSLRGRDVRNGSLRAGDFKPGDLPRGTAGITGSQGAPGPQGAIGPQGTPGLSSLELVGGLTASNSDSHKSLTVECPAGKEAISTGYELIGAKTGNFPNRLTNVVVNEIGTTGNEAFLVAFEEEATADNWSALLTVLCGRVAT